MPEQQELPQWRDIYQRIPNIHIRSRKMKTIDKEVLAGYNAGIEKNRLHEGLGLIEFARSREILYAMLPPPPAVIYDIGWAYGEYAYDLVRGAIRFIYMIFPKRILKWHWPWAESMGRP